MIFFGLFAGSGLYIPPKCHGGVISKTAILVPVRNRLQHAIALSKYLHLFLQAQKRIQYKIYFVTQVSQINREQTA